mmetsp:Transcript_28393/g.27339  ORF Transcript_28393/g.27339 Transcript_28393/m.27339 type:complete len:96 (+) Transcript_28393:999-1286(+)
MDGWLGQLEKFDFEEENYWKEQETALKSILEIEGQVLSTFKSKPPKIDSIKFGKKMVENLANMMIFNRKHQGKGSLKTEKNIFARLFGMEQGLQR